MLGMSQSWEPGWMGPGATWSIGKCSWVTFKAPPKIKFLPVLFPADSKGLRLKHQSISPHKSIFCLVKEHLGRNSQAARHVVLAISEALEHQHGPSILRLRVDFLYQNPLLVLKTSRQPLAGAQDNVSHWLQPLLKSREASPAQHRHSLPHRVTQFYKSSLFWWLSSITQVLKIYNTTIINSHF